MYLLISKKNIQYKKNSILISYYGGEAGGFAQEDIFVFILVSFSVFPGINYLYNKEKTCFFVRLSVCLSVNIFHFPNNNPINNRYLFPDCIKIIFIRT